MVLIRAHMQSHATKTFARHKRQSFLSRHTIVKVKAISDPFTQPVRTLRCDSECSGNYDGVKRLSPPCKAAAQQQGFPEEANHLPVHAQRKGKKLLNRELSIHAGHNRIGGLRRPREMYASHSLLAFGVYFSSSGTRNAL